MCQVHSSVPIREVHWPVCDRARGARLLHCWVILRSELGHQLHPRDPRLQRELTDPELMQQLTNAIPLGRIGKPDEIGEVVAFMATDHAGFVVGETIEVNGGAYMI